MKFKQTFVFLISLGIIFLIGLAGTYLLRDQQVTTQDYRGIVIKRANITTNDAVNYLRINFTNNYLDYGCSRGAVCFFSESPEIHYNYSTIDLQGYKSRIILNASVWENYSFCYGPNPFPIVNNTIIYVLEIISECKTDFIKGAEGIVTYGSDL